MPPVERLIRDNAVPAFKLPFKSLEGNFVQFALVGDMIRLEVLQMFVVFDGESIFVALFPLVFCQIHPL